MNRLLYKICFIVLVLFLAFISACPQSPQSDILFSKGIEMCDNGDYAEAIKCFTEAKELDDKEIDKNSYRNDYTLAWVAYCWYKSGNEEKAKDLSRYDYFHRPPDRRLTKNADLEADLTFAAMDRGDYEEALRHALLCMDLEEKVLGRESISYIGSCVTLSRIYKLLCDYVSSLKYCEMGLDLMQSMGIRQDDLEFQLRQRRVYALLGQNMLALTMTDMDRLKEIGRILEDEFGDSEATVEAKFLEARIEIQRGLDYEKSLSLVEETFRMALNAFNPENTSLFLCLRDCLQMLGMSNGTEIESQLIEEALRACRDGEIVFSDGQKGTLLYILGDLMLDPESAFRCYNEADACLKDSDSLEFYYYNKCGLAMAYASKNDVDRCIELLNEVCDFYESETVLSNVHKHALMLLADMYKELGSFQESASLYRKILGFLEKDKSDPQYFLTLLKWIPVYAEVVETESDIEVAAELGRELKMQLSNVKMHDLINQGIGIPYLASVLMPFYRALFSNASLASGINWTSVIEELRMFIYNSLIPLCSEKDPLSCEALSILAYGCSLLGEYDKAIGIMSKVADIARESGWECDGYLHDLGYIQFDSGDTANAYGNFRIGFEYIKEGILRNYHWMTLEERSKFTDAKRGNLDNLPHYAAMIPEDARYAGLGYDAMLFTKGLLLNSQIELSRMLAEDGDKESLRLLEELRKINQQLHESENSGKGDVDELKKHSVRIEKQLMEKSKTFGDYTKNLAVTYQEVQSGLGYNDVAIEMCRFWKSAKSMQYGAIVLTKAENPIYVDLGSDRDWGINTLSEDHYMEEGLFEKLLGNILPFFPTKDRGVVFFAPDGIFHMIPIENLPGSEPYDLRRVSSTREVAQNHGAPSSVSSMALFGGVDYGLGTAASFYSDVKKGKRNSSDFLEYLPGAFEEVTLIKKALEGRMKVDVKTGKNATKTNFMKCSGKRPDLIHVATHGFFSDADTPIDQGKDPLACSGLYFAGAQNTLWNMDADKLKDNGILTALEISTLDFRGVRLAVLSACETGRGAIAADGVFGLQRAFKQAGVRSLMISLWKVDDDVTKMLMTEFYGALLGGRLPSDALKLAQCKTREVFPHSNDWAAFVLIDADNGVKF